MLSLYLNKTNALDLKKKKKKKKKTIPPVVTTWYTIWAKVIVIVATYRRVVTLGVHTFLLFLYFRLQISPRVLLSFLLVSFLSTSLVCTCIFAGFGCAIGEMCGGLIPKRLGGLDFCRSENE